MMGTRDLWPNYHYIQYHHIYCAIRAQIITISNITMSITVSQYNQ